MQISHNHRSCSVSLRVVAILAFLLTVFVAGIHCEAVNAKPQKVEAAGEYAISPSSVPPDTASAKQEQNLYRKARKYLRKSFGPEYLAAWILVVAAGIGLYATFRTLDMLESQTKSIKDSAEAALLNAQAVINTERPWMVVTWRSDDKNPELARFGCRNWGNTPAKIVAVSAEPVFVDDLDSFSLEPAGTETLPDLNLIGARDSFPITGLNPESYIRGHKKEFEVGDSRKFLIYYGKVVYRDVLYPDASDNGLHETHWCFVYQPSGKKRFVRTGPSKYNSYS
jgi:hypothetical protein